MSHNKPIFRLHKCSRSFGDLTKRNEFSKEYIMENKSIDVLINHIKMSNEGNKFTYIIEKYINNDIRWRQLGRRNNCRHHGWEKGDLTTTWEKYIWDDNIKSWRTSCYRYDDEII